MEQLETTSKKILSYFEPTNIKIDLEEKNNTFHLNSDMFSIFREALDNGMIHKIGGSLVSHYGGIRYEKCSASKNEIQDIAIPFTYEEFKRKPLIDRVQYDLWSALRIMNIIATEDSIDKQSFTYSIFLSEKITVAKMETTLRLALYSLNNEIHLRLFSIQPGSLFTKYDRLMSHV